VLLFPHAHVDPDAAGAAAAEAGDRQVGILAGLLHAVFDPGGGADAPAGSFLSRM
jgi:hypothetical protein